MLSKFTSIYTECTTSIAVIQFHYMNHIQLDNWRTQSEIGREKQQNSVTAELLQQQSDKTAEQPAGVISDDCTNDELLQGAF